MKRKELYKGGNVMFFCFVLFLSVCCCCCLCLKQTNRSQDDFIYIYYSAMQISNIDTNKYCQFPMFFFWDSISSTRLNKEKGGIFLKGRHCCFFPWFCCCFHSFIRSSIHSFIFCLFVYLFFHWFIHLFLRRSSI